MAKSKKKQPKRYLFEEVLAFLRHNSEKAFNYKQLGSAMEIDNEGDRFALLETLEELKHQGFVTEKETGKYQAKENKVYETGTIDFTTQGTAFVIISPELPDVFIPFRRTKDALQGDLVKIAVQPQRGREKPEGEVIEVIQRKKTKYVGTIQINPKFAFVVPDYTKIHVDFFIPIHDINGAKNGQKVLVELTDWKKGSDNPNGKVVDVLGTAGEHETEINAIMAEFGLPMVFAPEVEAAAKKLATDITSAEIAKRRDFREITTFTIDPVDAKDFDDALSLQKLENGNWEVGVHIADVTHYLKPHTILDDEAVSRATSVYLVDRCVPMLPEVLSNFACSLRPHEEKYCFSAVFELDDNAQIQDQWFGKTVIYSDHRFSYEEVQTIIETGEGPYKEEIFTLDRLAKILRAERTAKGSIFFDKAEVKFQLDDKGAPTGVYFKTQKDAHKLIEDFMLLANRKVAEFLGKKGKDDQQKNNNQKKVKNEKGSDAVVYRIHDVPKDEKLLDLNNFVERFGYSVAIGNKTKTAQSINKLLQDVKNKKEQSMIELLAVRSMPKAIYTTKNVGHYGLGFDYYTHFTSPIRRYPDVMVHRLLEAKLNQTHYLKADELELLCKHSSEMEKLASDAERASVKYKQVEYLENKIGQEFEGVISGVTEWGIFVEIIENKCEGRVSMRDMKDDQYSFDEDNYRVVGRRTGRVYTLGDKVKIIVKRADLIKKQLDFEFVSGIPSTKEPEIRNPKRYKKRK
ncbi:MAG: ribonuclease [Bacteroidetes bacterium]|jgi:ribonuclease R|nr:ribonuclease [Bacteroidota bacterium]MDF2451733.1 ribonuclease [Bacteroidota bacterium]